MKFSLDKFIRSFGYAVRGVAEVFRKEQNFKVHTLMGMLAILLGFLFRIAPWEWCFLAVVIALVMAFEMVNTAIEHLCDITHPEQNETVRVIKDISAGMVLLCAIGALTVGIVIFLPKLIDFIGLLL